jgi:multidrug efflux pump subunit AcrA (membrane-fusion protein)
MSIDLKLLPGMKATVNIVSGSKTILSYLMQPVTNIKNKAFRER